MDSQEENAINQVANQCSDGNVADCSINGRIVVTIRDPQGNDLGQFEANGETNIAAQAVASGILVPVSCGGGVCGVCLCKVIQGGEVLKADAFNSPLIPLQNDKDGNPAEVLACIAGFKPDAFNDGQEHVVILQRTY